MQTHHQYEEIAVAITGGIPRRENPTGASHKPHAPGSHLRDAHAIDAGRIPAGVEHPALRAGLARAHARGPARIARAHELPAADPLPPAPLPAADDLPADAVDTRELVRAHPEGVLPALHVAPLLHEAALVALVPDARQPVLAHVARVVARAGGRDRRRGGRAAPVRAHQAGFADPERVLPAAHAQPLLHEALLVAVVAHAGERLLAHVVRRVAAVCDGAQAARADLVDADEIVLADPERVDAAAHAEPLLHLAAALAGVAEAIQAFRAHIIRIVAALRGTRNIPAHLVHTGEAVFANPERVDAAAHAEPLLHLAAALAGVAEAVQAVGAGDVGVVAALRDGGDVTADVVDTCQGVFADPEGVDVALHADRLLLEAARVARVAQAEEPVVAVGRGGAVAVPRDGAREREQDE